MVMLAEDYDFVIGGDPDRDSIDLAVVDATTGGVRGHITDFADGAGYQRLLSWSREHAPGRRVWALEGTGSFAAGLVTALTAAGEDIVEITGAQTVPRCEERPDRCDCCCADSVVAEHQSVPRAQGLREALRQVMATRQAVLVSRTKAINEFKSLIVVAPEDLRSGLRGQSLHKQLEIVELLTTPVGAAVERRVTILMLRSIAARIRFLLAQTAELDPELLALVKQHAAGRPCSLNPVSDPSSLLNSWSAGPTAVVFAAKQHSPPSPGLPR